jgi:lysophospholipase L1-like esterase
VIENNYLTYGAFAARELGAAYSAIAWSGKGVLRNYDPVEAEPMPEIYERVLPADASAGLAPASPRPDAVVINLGTNDIAANIPDGPTFERGYLTLLRRVRARYPDALLVIALGPMLADDFPQPRARSLMRDWLKSIEATWRAKGDDRIAWIELWTDPAEGLGCDYHPSIRTHARMGVELAALLRERLGW